MFIDVIIFVFIYMIMLIIVLMRAHNFSFGVGNRIILGLTGNTYRVLTFIHNFGHENRFGLVGFIRIECTRAVGGASEGVI